MSKQRAKMPQSQRAKQFAPFDALTGLRAALKEKEKIRVKKKTVSEDMAREINEALLKLKTGDTATLIYYNCAEQQYFKIEGKVKSINNKKRTIQIEEVIINIDDIYWCE